MIVYISYDEPRRFPWGRVLAILLALVALAVVISGAVWLVNNGQNRTAAAPASGSPAHAVPLPEAVAPLYAANTNTIFLVDVSESIKEGGNLDALKFSLLNVALPYSNPAAGTAAENSRVALVAFTNARETLVPLGSLDDTGNQRAWLESMETLETEDEGAFIFDAVNDMYDRLADESDDTRSKVIVLLTDGADGGVVRGTDEPVYSEMSRDDLVTKLATGSITVHTIGFGEAADHISLKILAQVTDGEYIYASR